MSWRRGFIAVVCVACGGQVATPSPGAGGSTGAGGGATATGGAATATDGAATATSAGGIAADAGGKASDAEIMDVVDEYCAICPADGCVAGFEGLTRMLLVPCTRAWVKVVRCYLAGGPARACPPPTPEGAKAPPPLSGPCSDQETAYLNCETSHTPMPP